MTYHIHRISHTHIGHISHNTHLCARTNAAFLSLSFSNTHTKHTHTHTYTLSHTHIHTRTRTLTLTHTITNTHTYTPTHAHEKTHTKTHTIRTTQKNKERERANTYARTPTLAQNLSAIQPGRNKCIPAATKRFQKGINCKLCPG